MGSRKAEGKEDFEEFHQALSDKNPKRSTPHTKLQNPHWELADKCPSVTLGSVQCLLQGDFLGDYQVPRAYSQLVPLCAPWAARWHSAQIRRADLGTKHVYQSQKKKKELLLALGIEMVPEAMRKDTHRPREIAQAAKSLLYKHQELSLIP